jgi:hypothetical protein
MKETSGKFQLIILVFCWLLNQSDFIMQKKRTKKNIATCGDNRRRIHKWWITVER